MTGSTVSKEVSLIFGVYCACGVCAISHVCAVPQTCDVFTVVIVASEIIWKAGTLITSADQQQRKQNKQGKGFLISLHLSSHQFSFLRPLGWFVPKAR